jgi:tetratricopeptide (TPR) repeat protein
VKIRRSVFFLVFLLFFGGCAQVKAPHTSASAPTIAVSEFALDETDPECSYFYFLWGRYAELTSHFNEALEAYEKALICDQQADYIARKLPLILLRLHREGEAITRLKEYLEKHPRETGARMLLAKILIHRKSYDEAIEEYRTIHRQEPEETRSLLLLSELYLSRRQLKAAGDALQEVLVVSPDNYPAHVLLARIFVEKNQIGKAFAQYHKALTLNWSAELEMEIGELYLQKKKFARAEALYKKIISREPNNEEAGIALVHTYLLQKKEKNALAELNRLKTISSNPEQMELSIARIYARRKQYGKAADILREILLRENLPKAHYLLGIISFQLKKYEDALFQLQQIPDSAEEYEDSLFLRVRLLRVLKRSDDAIAVLEQALAQGNKIRNADLYVLLATLYQERGEDTLGEKIFDRVLAMYPKNDGLLYEYGLFLDQTGKRQRAMKVMKKVITLAPEHAAALNYVGYTWADHKEHLDQALAYIMRAVKLKPKNGYIRDSLGWVYYRLGRFDRAQKELVQAARLSADDPAILDHLGDVYLELGRQDKAVQSYRKALKKYTEDQDKARVQKKIWIIEKQQSKTE